MDKPRVQKWFIHNKHLGAIASIVSNRFWHNNNIKDVCKTIVNISAIHPSRMMVGYVCFISRTQGISKEPGYKKLTLDKTADVDIWTIYGRYYIWTCVGCSSYVHKSCMRSDIVERGQKAVPDESNIIGSDILWLKLFNVRYLMAKIFYSMVTNTWNILLVQTRPAIPPPTHRSWQLFHQKCFSHHLNQ